AATSSGTAPRLRRACESASTRRGDGQHPRPDEEAHAAPRPLVEGDGRHGEVHRAADQAVLQRDGDDGVEGVHAAMDKAGDPHAPFVTSVEETEVRNKPSTLPRRTPARPLCVPQPQLSALRLLPLLMAEDAVETHRTSQKT